MPHIWYYNYNIKLFNHPFGWRRPFPLTLVYCRSLCQKSITSSFKSYSIWIIWFFLTLGMLSLICSFYGRKNQWLLWCCMLKVESCVVNSKCLLLNFVLCMYCILIFHKFTSPLNGCRHDNIMYICCACWVIHCRWLLVRIGLWSSGQMYVLEFENQWDFFFFKATNNWYRLMLKDFYVFDFCIKWKYWSFLDSLEYYWYGIFNSPSWVIFCNVTCFCMTSLKMN